MSDQPNNFGTLIMNGDSGTDIDHHNIATVIQQILNQGFNLVNDGSVGAVFDSDPTKEQTFIVSFEKIANRPQTGTPTPAEPTGGGETPVEPDGEEPTNPSGQKTVRVFHRLLIRIFQQGQAIKLSMNRLVILFHQLVIEVTTTLTAIQRNQSRFLPLWTNEILMKIN